MSDLQPVMASPRTLREWCRVSCASYPDVHIEDMSSSFRDGLAFCALIHKHRPDLIDFSSLSKDNVYRNNKLAFQVAESNLGIPALLDPKEMVSSEVPDRLSVTTYLSQIYCVFNRKSHAGSAGLRSPHVAVFNSLTKTRSPDGVKPLKRASHLETDGLSHTRPQTVCDLCLTPVHLIQRRLVEGKIFHRSCFRCKVCHSTLLPESYTQGSDAGSLICSYHTTDLTRTHVDLSPEFGSADNRPKCNFQADYYSLGGLAITSLPRYTTESQERPVCEMPETEGRERRERSSEVKERENRHSGQKPAPPNPPLPDDADRTVGGQRKDGPAPILEDGKKQQVEMKNQQRSGFSSSCDRAMEGSGGQMLDASAVPVPAPRNKLPSKPQRSSAAGTSSIQSKCQISSSHVTTPTLRTNHPWMTIIHPGPWTQLPPAPAPVPTPRSKFLFKSRRTWIKPQVPAPNPFDEHLDESGGGLVNESGDTDVCSGDAENKSVDQKVKPLVGLVAGAAVSDPVIQHIDPALLDENGATSGSVPDGTESAAGRHAASEKEQNHFLPKSLSEPVITSVPSHGALTEATGSVASRQSKLVPRENPFDRKPSMPKSKTFQALPSSRAPAPGHGFPLIKRKVQTGQCLSTEDLQTEMEGVNKRLEALQERGVEMENNLRDCRNAHTEEQMLMDWFSLLHERQLLTRRDTELVYMIKQQRLEERQADVEYELRCLLNKPEKDWSQEDRGREQQLMDELVAVIEQRNQIISSLDQDRQREREEDGLSEDFRTNKEFQKEGLRELKKLKGKFKPTNVFKILNNKAGSIKYSRDKKS